MQRRRVEWFRDYSELLAMQRLSWKINFGDNSLSEDAFRTSLRSAVRRNGVWVYEVDGELVGWLWLDVHSPLVGVHIRHVQVRKAHWGRGIGRRIVEDAIAICVERKHHKITLNVTKSNLRAMRLYAGLGFVVEEDRGARQSMKLKIKTSR